MSKAFVAVQVALTVLLLAGAALFARSLLLIVSQHAGFERDGVAIVTTDPLGAGYRGDRLTAYYTEVLERLRRLPHAESAALAWVPPISNELGSWTQSIAVDGAEVPTALSRTVYFNAISPGYLATVRMRLLQGRDFTEADARRPPRSRSSTRRSLASTSATPTRSAAASASAATRREKISEIVGVVQDAKYQRLQESTRSIAFLPCAQLVEFMTGTNLAVVLRHVGRPGIRRDSPAVRGIDSGVPVHVETVADRIRESLVRERGLAALAVDARRRCPAPCLHRSVRALGLLGFATDEGRSESSSPSARSRARCRG